MTILTTPIIVDCDPGVDDAIALLLAFGLNIPIAAITTVAGNVPLSLTNSNARKICALAPPPKRPPASPDYKVLTSLSPPRLERQSTV